MCLDVVDNLPVATCNILVTMILTMGLGSLGPGP